MPNISELTDTQAIDAMTLIAELWLEHRGREAYGVMQKTYQSAAETKNQLPAWAMGEASFSSELAEKCRTGLQLMLTGRDPDTRQWVRQAINQVQAPREQAVDPLTLAIGGTIFIGFVLVSRVKKIGPEGVEFYEGLPEGMAKLLKEAATFLKDLA